MPVRPDNRAPQSHDLMAFVTPLECAAYVRTAVTIGFNDGFNAIIGGRAPAKATS
ncbi:hypothetical protein LRP30_33650 [Bradyrhizobium sp. C-145]|uniref:hypothetical protein n=1 Tax=Bradyrhizobium sp. C-145 TaxID=574727 RepID=UPI00201B52A5|nr:hypothetical protein [Bradyrhizobium sp. C-145]UQR61718.1 hypothetical protein LRP30_33650 [Bradyrhizobium sp. C-145]